MKPIKFKEMTTTLAKNQPEYIPLPVHVSDGIVISCWKLNWKERIKIFFTGKIWLQQLTFNRALQPQKISIDTPFEDKKDE